MLKFRLKLFPLVVLAAIACLLQHDDDPTLEPRPCPICADYNADGSIDGADVEAFFSDWGDGMAEVNCDGQSDEDDIVDFMEAWSVGAMC